MSNTLNEKEVIRNKVRKAWDDLSFYTIAGTIDDDTARKLMERWKALDDLWCELYDEEY